MRFARYKNGISSTFGIVSGELLEDIHGTPFGAYEKTGMTHHLDAVELLVPFKPRTFYAAGINYTEHIKEIAAQQGRDPNFPEKPDIGYRANNALIAHGQPIVKPKDATDHLQYEGELVAVIGKQAKNVSFDEALECVLGYTIGNDVSERTWQASDRTFWRAKNSDTFKPMGPWIETQVDLDLMRTTVRLNGAMVSEFSTNSMVFGIGTYITTMTKYLTLYPGDMIWMGTDGATQNMKIGDVCEIEIEGIGVLRNPIVEEE